MLLTSEHIALHPADPPVLQAAVPAVLQAAVPAVLQAAEPALLLFAGHAVLHPAGAAVLRAAGHAVVLTAGHMLQTGEPAEHLLAGLQPGEGAAAAESDVVCLPADSAMLALSVPILDEPPRDSLVDAAAAPLLA